MEHGQSISGEHAPAGDTATAGEVRVWDPLVRVFHWSLVAAFTVAWISGEEWDDVHEIAGYVVLGLVAFRVVWGFVGTRHARFTDFVRGPATVARYLASLLTPHPTHYLGHNPAGGWMVVALLAANLALCVSGLELLAAEGRGPLAAVQAPADAAMAAVLPAAARANGDDDDRRRGRERERGGDGEDFWEDVHEVLANLTLALVLVHIAGVIVSSALHRENLVRAMVTGRKRARPRGADTR